MFLSQSNDKGKKANYVTVSLITDSLSSEMSQEITWKTASFASCFTEKK